MSKSRISQSLMTSINGGKKASAGGDPFSEAMMDEDDAPEATAKSTNPRIEVDEQPVRVDVPKARHRKRNGLGVFFVGSSLVLAVAGLSLSGYGFHQIQLLKNVQNEMQGSVDGAIGSLTSKTDNLSVDLEQASEGVTANSARLASLPEIMQSVASLEGRINGLNASLDLLKPELATLRQELVSNSEGIATLEKKIQALNEKPRVVQTTKREVAPVVKREEQLLEGASVASIDVWGAQSSVVMQTADGRWIPLTAGDAFNGWRLSGVEDNRAVFRRGDKLKQVAVTE